ncbi:MAG: tRNA 2-thiocytidine biosynthesis protein TtcA [Candidatus Omnitrophica bacterium]|nr:tRNA 2-thiocytidine biosynthesis protein TtcA [Candidatus Omnitrophota bacterium]
MRKPLGKTGSFISSKIGKAIKDYRLIEDGDRILVGVSGGKDSITLLRLLKERQHWSPAKYDLIAAHVETDFKCGHCVHRRYLTALFKDTGLPYVFKKIKVKGISKKTVNCFWCSWNRRKELFKTAQAKGCNKVALGHHKDDICETILLNLFFQGEISTMNPRQPLFRGVITVIRPLCYVEERTIRRFVRESGLDKLTEKKMQSRDSNRKYLKRFIQDIEKRCPSVKTNIFRSIGRVKSEYIDLKTG